MAAAYNYRIEIFALSEEDGGGFLAIAHDLPGCMADGWTQREALANLHDAIAEWIADDSRNGPSGTRAEMLRGRLALRLHGADWCQISDSFRHWQLRLVRIEGASAGAAFSRSFLPILEIANTTPPPSAFTSLMRSSAVSRAFRGS